MTRLIKRHGIEEYMFDEYCLSTLSFLQKFFVFYYMDKWGREYSSFKNCANKTLEDISKNNQYNEFVEKAITALREVLEKADDRIVFSNKACS